MNALISQKNFLFKIDFAINARIRNATNKIPCAQPTYFTANGRPAKYFKGIAIKRSTRNEMPSVMAIILNHRSVLFCMNDVLERNADYHDGDDERR